MPGLAALAWRTLRARPARSLLTVVGIALGVAVLFAGLLTRLGIERSVDRTVSAAMGRADLRVAAFSERGLSPETVTAVGSVPGVVVAAPVLERRTYLGAGARVAPGGLPPAVTVLGIDPTVDGRVHDLAIAAGRTLANPGERGALVSERLAADAGLALGQELRLDGSPAADPADLRFPIVGIVAGDGPAGDPLGRTVVLPLAAAERAFGPSGVARVDLVLAAPTSADAVSAAIAARLTTEPYVITSPAELATSLTSSATEFEATTALVAAVALFAGAFLVFNTLSMTVAERLREVGLLRAAGATGRQVMAVVLAAAAILGAIGSILGLTLGWLLASVVSGRVGDLGGVRLGSLPVTFEPTATALAVGLAVTLAAAGEPARRASLVPPVEALRPRLEPAPATGFSVRWLVAVFLVVGLAGLLVRPPGDGLDALARGGGAYAVLFGLALSVPWLLEPLGRLAGVPFAAIVRTEERLASAGLRRDRPRAALTVGGLAIGIAALVALGGVASDARGTAASWIAGVVPGDVMATSVTPRGLDEGLAGELAASPGVARVTPIAGFDVAFRGVRLDAAAVVGADLLADGRLTFVDGDRRAALSALDAGGATVVPRSVATRLGLRVGDDLDFPVGDARTVRLRVAGIVDRSLPGRGGEALLVGWNDATSGFGIAGPDAFAVRFAPSASAQDRAALDALAQGAGLQPTPLAAVEGAVGDALGRVFGVFDALAVLAVVIGGLGIANTLAMSVVERVRELGVLRAAGMTRRQVWRLVVVEAGLLGAIGAVLGIVGGVLAGAVMQAVASGGAIELALPWASIGLAVVLGLCVSMLAAAYPAWLAARLSIVRAVRAE